MTSETQNDLKKDQNQPLPVGGEEMPAGLAAMFERSKQATVGDKVETWADLVQKARKTLEVEPGWMFVRAFNQHFNRVARRLGGDTSKLIDELVNKRLAYHYNEPGRLRALASAQLMNLMWGGDKEEYPDSTEEERGQRIHQNIGLLCLTVIARERALKRKIR